MSLDLQSIVRSIAITMLVCCKHIGQWIDGLADVYESFSTVDPEDVKGEAINDLGQILKHSPPGGA